VLLCLLYGNWCAVTATSFGQTIGLPAIVDFTQANAATDDASTVTGFQIKLPLPNGTLTKASVAVVMDDVCGDGDCTYTPLISECAGGGDNDHIVFMAMGSGGDFSTSKLVIIIDGTFNCVGASDFSQAISAGTGAIDFSSVGVTDSALQVKINILPGKGTLTVTAGGAAADTSTKYDRDALTYTANPSECAAGVTDTFPYNSFNSSDEESDEATATLTVAVFTCVPTAADFAISSIDQTTAVAFTGHVTDQTDTDADVKVKIQALPTKGTLTVTSSEAAADTSTEYGQTVLTYTSSDAECAADYTDTFTYKSIDSVAAESSEQTVTLNALAFTCPVVASTSSTSTSSTTTSSSSSDSFETWKIIVIVVAGLAAIGMA